ncbi:MAG: DUF1329 domain-containing protein [Halieaceae bacterium]|jgi:hypothetical protein|nr:DUF1329 domain-containing protein [Halieaceae bacterium]
MRQLFFGLLLACTASLCLADATPEEIASLGGPVYTPVGAERAGNAEGTIPEWQDGLPDFGPDDMVDGALSNPFSGERELFRISAANLDDYRDKLSDGQVALLERYPETYYLPVYPSHRVATYPQSVLERVRAAAADASMVPSGNGLKNLEASTVPFPFPDSALEVIWNHIVRYRGGSVQRTYTQIPVQANGAFNPVVFQDKLVFASALKPGEVSDNRLFLYLQQSLEPPRFEGDMLLVHENIDQFTEPRNAWVYNAGQRRVRRAPNVAYDGPGNASDGLRTADDLDGYNGAPDRYDWKLLGKREMYVGMNAYELNMKSLDYSDIILPGHINPAHTRYELHRTWVVEATLKEGERHIYARRVFYIDEDSWSIVLKDQYDGRGELWRVSQSHGIYHFDAMVPWGAEVQNDLQSGRYLVTGLDNEVPGRAYIWGLEARAGDFTPQALRRLGRR